MGFVSGKISNIRSYTVQKEVWKFAFSSDLGPGSILSAYFNGISVTTAWASDKATTLDGIVGNFTTQAATLGAALMGLISVSSDADYLYISVLPGGAMFDISDTGNPTVITKTITYEDYSVSAFDYAALPGTVDSWVVGEDIDTIKQKVNVETPRALSIANSGYDDFILVKDIVYLTLMNKRSVYDYIGNITYVSSDGVTLNVIVSEVPYFLVRNINNNGYVTQSIDTDGSSTIDLSSYALSVNEFTLSGGGSVDTINGLASGYTYRLSGSMTIAAGGNISFTDSILSPFVLTSNGDYLDIYFDGSTCIVLAGQSRD